MFAFTQMDERDSYLSFSLSLAVMSPNLFVHMHAESDSAIASSPINATLTLYDLGL